MDTKVKKMDLEKSIKELVQKAGADPDSKEGTLIVKQIATSLKLLHEGHDTGQIKLITHSLKEMRYAYRVFNQYPKRLKISIFGSARTPEDHPDYQAASKFSCEMTERGWSCITGAAHGIMKAGLVGGPESSFGLSILLPFETTTNELIEDNPKLISFRYFFTRKLMFMSHSDALAVFPGGFGTLDELYEMLTLIHNGKANIIPIILLEGEGGVYWHHWENYMEKNLLENGWISEDDPDLYKIVKTVDEGIEHVTRFYHRYHSSRYVGDHYVMRIKKPLTDDQIEILNDEFHELIASGEITQRAPFEEEEDHLDLTRIVFHHNKRHYGTLRKMIDRVNNF